MALKQRILTAAVALPLLIIFLLCTDRIWLTVLVSLANLLGLIEYTGMAFPAGSRAERLLLVGGGSLLLPLWLLGGAIWPSAGLMVLVIAFSLLVLARPGELSLVAGRLGIGLFGLLYVTLLLSSVVLLFDQPYGRKWLFLVLMVVMAADSAAFFVGRSLGRTKLYPLISPNKSREGAVGGLLGSVFAACLAKLLFFPELGWTLCLAGAVAMSLLGQSGDLVESMLKRSFGVKDSGQLLPGHGGILDRLDSLLFAFPTALLCAVLAGS